MKNDFIIENGILTKYNGNKKAVIIPNGVVEIGEKAFAFNEDVTSVTIPNTVEIIGEASFAFCENLVKVVLGDSVSKIKTSAFSHCENLKSVNLPILSLSLDHDYEKVELLNLFLDKMDPVSIAQMKKNKN